MKLVNHLITYLAITAVFAGIFAIGYLGNQYTRDAREEAGTLLLEAAGLAGNSQPSAKPVAPTVKPTGKQPLIADSDRNRLAEGLSSLATALESYQAKHN